MSRLAINNLKSKLRRMYDTNIKINIGIYDDNDNIVEEKNVPLGNYLNDPLDEIELRSIAKKLNLPPSAWVRKTEKEFKDNKIHNIIHDDDKLYEAMCKYPKIIERPIIIRGEKAVIGRPPENIYQLI